MPVSQVTKAGQGPHQRPSSRQSCWTPSMVASGPVRSGNTANPLRRSSSVAGASSGSALNPSVRRSNSDTTWPRPSESTSNTQHPTSNTQHPTSNIQHPTSNTQHPTSNTQHPTPNTQHPTPNIQHPTSNTQHPTSNTQHPTPNIQRGRSRRRTIPPEAKAESRKSGQAPPEPPQGLLLANRLRPASHPHAALMQLSCDPNTTPEPMKVRGDGGPEAAGWSGRVSTRSGGERQPADGGRQTSPIPRG